MKKVLAILIAVCLCTSTVVSAIDNTAHSVSDNVRIGIIEALQFIEPLKADYGLERVDFTEIAIGNPISAYEYADGEFEEILIYYPLFDAANLIALAVNVKENLYQIIPELAQPISNTGFSEIALVYDATGCYAYNGHSFSFLAAATSDLSWRSILSPAQIVSPDILLLSDLSFSEQLGYTSALPTVSPRSANVSYTTTLDVSYMPQGSYENICWAATIACIVDYYVREHDGYSDLLEAQLNSGGLTIFEQNALNDALDGELTAVSVAKAYRNSGIESVFNAVEAPSVGGLALFLEEFFLIDYYSFYSVPSDYMINLNLSENSPIVAMFIIQGTEWSHFVTIYGINSPYNYVRMMNPSEGFRIATRDGNSYSYIKASEATTWVWDATAAYYQN